MPRSALARRLPNLLSLGVLLLLAVNYFSPFADLDFAWQIRTGEQIIRQGTLRPSEAFTYTIAGSSVPDFEWLYELVLYGTWSTLGVGGLKLLQTILVSSTLALLGYRLARDGVRWHGIAVALAVAVSVGASAWNLRPMYCTSLGLLLLVGWLSEHCQARRPLPWYLPLVLLLWANLHPGIIVAQGLLLGAIGWEWLNTRLRINPPLTKTACLRLTIVGGLGFLATFASPNPIERLLYPFRPEVAHPVQRNFVEMRPLLSVFPEQPHTILTVYALAALVGLSVVLRFRHYRVWQLCLLLGLAGLAHLAARSLHDWLLMMLALGVPHLAALLGSVGRRVRSAQGPFLGGLRLLLRLDRSCKKVMLTPYLRWQPAWPLLFGAGFVILTLWPGFNDHFSRESRLCPAQAAGWMKAHGIHGRFFGVPEFGTYVGWRLGEDGKSYVDTRGFFFPPELLEDALYLPRLRGDWQPRLARVLERGTDYFLLETVGPRGEMWRALQDHVGSPLYLDEQAVLLSAGQVRLGADRLAALAHPQPPVGDIITAGVGP
jgi:hypothetical protein